jgi:hypothetical protein
VYVPLRVNYLVDLLVGLTDITCFILSLATYLHDGSHPFRKGCALSGQKAVLIAVLCRKEGESLT